MVDLSPLNLQLRYHTYRDLTSFSCVIREHTPARPRRLAWPAPRRLLGLRPERGRQGGSVGRNGRFPPSMWNSRSMARLRSGMVKVRSSSEGSTVIDAAS